MHEDRRSIDTTTLEGVIVRRTSRTQDAGRNGLDSTQQGKSKRKRLNRNRQIQFDEQIPSHLQHKKYMRGRMISHAIMAAAVGLARGAYAVNRVESLMESWDMPPMAISVLAPFFTRTCQTKHPTIADLTSVRKSARRWHSYSFKLITPILEAITMLSQPECVAVAYPSQRCHETVFKTLMKSNFKAWAMVTTPTMATALLTTCTDLQMVHVRCPFTPTINGSPKASTINEFAILTRGLSIEFDSVITANGITFANTKDNDQTFLRQDILVEANETRKLKLREAKSVSQNTAKRIADCHAMTDSVPMAATVIGSNTEHMGAEQTIEEATSSITAITAHAWTPRTFGKCILAAELGAKAHPELAPLLLQELTKCATLTQPRMRAMAAKALKSVYELDRALLEDVTGSLIAFLLTCEPETRHLLRRCRGALSKLLLAEPARAKLAISTQMNQVLARNTAILPHVSAIFNKWIKNCHQASLAVFVDPDEWRDILRALEVPQAQVSQTDDTNNFEIWDHPKIDLDESFAENNITEQMEREEQKERDYTIIAHNCNGFRKRWASGTIQRFLRDESPDIYHLTEVRSDVRHLPDLGDVKASLIGLGYRYCYWTWCTKKGLGYGYSGSAIFCKTKPTSVSFGTGDADLDPEGRIITIRYPAFTYIGSYSPCSAYGSEPLQRRTQHDATLTAWTCKEQRTTKAVIVGGDLNIAPKPEDVGTDLVEPDHMPSCQPEERKDHATLLRRANLTDSYRHFHRKPSASDYTWHRSRRHLKLKRGLRIDHFLCEKELLDATGSHGIIVTGCDKMSYAGGSDHFPLRLKLHVPAKSATNVKPPPGAAPQAPADKHHGGMEDYGNDTDAIFQEICVAQRSYDDDLILEDDDTVSEWCKPSTARTQTAEPDAKCNCKANTTNSDHSREVNSDRKEQIRPTKSACISKTTKRVNTQKVSDSKAKEQNAELACGCKSASLTSPSRQNNSDDNTQDVNLEERLSTFLLGLKNVMPESVLKCGPRHANTQVLFDTGSKSNLTTKAHADKCAATWISTNAISNSTPTFILADGSRQKPIGLVEMTLHLDATHSMRLFAWVMEDGPYDIILGSQLFKEKEGAICYSTMTISIKLKGERVKIDFIGNEEIRQEAAAALYATEDIYVPPKHHVLVPVNPSSRTTLQKGTWGLVSNTSADVDFMVAKMCFPLWTNNIWVQISNLSPEPIVIRRAQQVAWFHRQDKSAYHHVAGCSLDELDVVATSKVNEAIDIDTEWASRDYLQPITIDTSAESLDNAQLRKLKGLILGYHELWDKDATKTPKAHGVTCDIELTDVPRMRARRNNTNPNARKEVAKLVQEQLDQDIIQNSCSPYSSTALLVPKPDGRTRFVIDYRELNKIVKRDAYPLPRVDDTLSALQGAKFFSAIDIVTAFWQIPLSERSRPLTAFSTPDGLFEYTRMPMGLATASGVFSRFIDEVLAGLKWTCVLTYIDDCLIYSKTFDEHLKALEKVFDRLRDYGLTLGAKKCKFAVKEVNFLGHVVNEHGIRPDPAKTSAISRLHLPNDKKGLRSTLGIFGYYRKYVQNYSSVAQPLNAVLAKNYTLVKDKNGQVQWTEKERTAFEHLKRELTRDSILAHPDWSKPFIVDTDACGHGLGAVLSQAIDGEEKVVCYASRSITIAESAYAVYELEALAVYWACTLFNWYLWRTKFLVRTDSNAVKWVMQKAVKGRLLKWALSLQELQYEVEHRKGTKHCNADGLSRCPLLSTQPYGVEPQEQIYGVPPPLPVSTVGVANTCAAKAYFPPIDNEAWSPTELRGFQLTDPTCMKIHATMLKDTSDNTSRYHLNKENVLCVNATEKSNARIVVPESLKAFILQRHHGLPLSGHVGRNKMLKLMATRYWWKNMSRDVGRWIKACAICCRRKTPRPKHAGKPYSVCTTPYPFHTVAIDLVGPIEETLKGNKYILTMLDLFTRWTIAVPIPSKDAEVVAHAIHSNLTTKHACPENIYSDRGTEFVNAGLQAMCTRWGIKAIASTGWQPQANPVERVHRWLNSSMTPLQRKFGNEWDLYVDAVIFAFNTSHHDSTGYSPFALLYGRQPRLPEDIMLGTPVETYADEEDYKIRASKWMAEAYKMVLQSQARMAERNRLTRDDNASYVAFKKGDQILYWQPAPAEHKQSQAEPAIGRKTTQVADHHDKAPSKFALKWSGPHVITESVEENHYVFQHSLTGASIKAHVNRLCRFNPWSDDLPSTSPEIDTNKPWKCGGRVEAGSLFVFANTNEPTKATLPFGLGLATEVNENGITKFTFVGNMHNNVRGTYRLGWKARDGAHYYAAQKKHEGHRPYELLGFIIPHGKVIVHQFALTNTFKIPVPVLRAITSSGSVEWAIEP